MHITNGIVIQIKSYTTRDRHPSNRILVQRKRSFKAIENKLPRYKGITRDEPTHLNSPIPYDQPYENQIEISDLIDFFWILLRMNSSTIPGWKGFNFLIHPFNDEPVHEITYLPAINESPTKMDTVLELLYQSKEKAEKLGLVETDVVLDQAIYAKACEVNLIIKILIHYFHNTIGILSE